MANYNVKERVTFNGRTFFVMKVKARDIELCNFGYHGSTDLKTLTEAGIIGMNGCFFGKASNGKTTLYNIAYQGGKPIGSLSDDTDAKRNQTGKGLIYWDGTSLRFNDYVADVTSLKIPTASNSWMQGGINLYFGYNNWETMMEPTMEDVEWNDLRGRAYRTAMVAHISKNDLYLFACPKTQITFSELRKDIFSYFGITESTSSAYKGIALDGGISTQIRGYSESGVNGAETPFLVRAVAQVIKNTYLSK